MKLIIKMEPLKKFFIKRILIQDIYIDEDGNLRIKVVKREDQGNYRCLPENELGSSGRSNPTSLVLSDPPKFVIKPNKSYITQQGAELMIACTGGGSLPWKAVWRKVSKFFWKI